MIGKLKNIVFGITFLTTLSVFGQRTPVQVIPQMIPPYSLSLSEYATSFNEKISLTLILTDVEELNLQVGIRLYIKNGREIDIKSAAVVTGANPLFLDGGIPLRIPYSDLQPYFQLQNLQGISPQQYNQPLPDGMYQFCFEVFEWSSGQPLSRESCANAYLVLNDPPILNFPSKGEMIKEKDPQNIVFQWTPRHLNARNVEYEFTLVELWDNRIDPQTAFLSGRPLYQETTRANTMLYGPGETALLPDKMYAWRVRAIENDGISETLSFRNNGYSEIFHFTYAGNCNDPQFVLAEGSGINGQKIMWQGFEHLKYNVQYRKKDVSNAVWFNVESYNEYRNIYDLEPGTLYEFRVGGQCTLNGPYTYSQIYEFTTAIKTDQETTYNCGITPEIVITNKELLKELKVGQVFTAGDFPLTVKEIRQVGDVYTGAGVIDVPYLGDTKIAVTFERIKINTDFQLIEGTVVTAYDASNWTDPDSMIGVTDEINRITSDIKATAEGTLDFVESIINKIREGEMTGEGLESIIENIKDKLPIESINELESIKNEILELEEALENAETDEEKEKIQNQIDELNQQYADTMEDVMNKMETLIVKAIEKYYIQNKSQESTFVNDYVNIYGEKPSSSEVNSVVTDLVVENDVAFEYEGEVLITDLPDEIKAIFKVQEKYYTYFIAKAIYENREDAEGMRTFINKAVDVDVDLLETLKIGKDNEDSDDVILEALVENIEKALKQLINNNKYSYLN